MRKAFPVGMVDEAVRCVVFLAESKDRKAPKKGQMHRL